MLIGVDYASVDANAKPDFPAFQAACAKASSSAGVVIMRAAWGTSPDFTVRRDWQAALDAGLTRGAYLYLRTHPTILPEDQVHVFADTVGRLGVTDLVPVLDLEDKGMGPHQEFEWLHRAWVEMKRIYGAAPMIYDSQRVWADDLPGMNPGEMTDSPQWVAHPWPYRVHADAQLSGVIFANGKWSPDTPRAWGAGNWWLHQYQGDAVRVPGFTSTVDLSRFNLMRQGEGGARVSWVQRRLGMRETGLFDVNMADRLRAFQRQYGLVADAVIGPKTFAVISWHGGVEQPLHAA